MKEHDNLLEKCIEAMTRLYYVAVRDVYKFYGITRSQCLDEDIVREAAR